MTPKSIQEAADFTPRSNEGPCSDCHKGLSCFVTFFTTCQLHPPAKCEGEYDPEIAKRLLELKLKYGPNFWDVLLKRPAVADGAKDTDRLNWLQANHGHTLNQHGATNMIRFEWTFADPDLRTAIDKAMAGQPTPPAEPPYGSPPASIAKATALEAELKEAREQLERSTVDLWNLKDRADKAEARATTYCKEIFRHQAALASALEQVTTLQARVTALEDSRDSWKKIAESGANKLNESVWELDASRKQVAELTEELALHKAAFTPNGALARENEELREKLNLRPLALSVGQLAGKHEQARARITALEAALNEARGVAGGALINFSPDLNPNGCWLLRDSIAIMDAALAPASAPTETEKEQ